MGKRFEVGARIAVALRWLLQRLHLKRIGPVVLSEYDGIATPIRSGNDPVALTWSLWIVFGKWFRGWGSVRTWARNEDLEIWIAGTGPFGAESGRVDLFPRVTAAAEEFRCLRVRNAACNKRDATAHIQLIGRIPSLGVVSQYQTIGDYYFSNLPAGDTAQILMDGCGALPSVEIEVSTLIYKTRPVGDHRIERLYGRPEWMEGKWGK